LSSFDIVPNERLRPFIFYQQLSEDENPFFRFKIPLPKDLLTLQNDDYWLSSYEAHKDFKQCLHLVNVFYDSEKKALICLALAFLDKDIVKEQTIKRAQMVASMHFLNLKENCRLFSSRIDPKNNLKPNNFMVTLNIDPKYVGLAIGKSGANIQKARRLPGINSLELDNTTTTFIITGIFIFSFATISIYFIF